MSIKRIETRAVEKEGRNNNTFFVYSIREADGTWVKCKFRKEVKNLPDAKGKYIMVVDTVNMNQSSDDYGKVWWVAKVEAFEQPERDNSAETAF